MGYSSASPAPARSMAGRLALVQQYGSHTLAYSTLQKGMQYFDTAQGYITYCEHESSLGKTVAVLGDPICAPGHHAETIQQFTRQFPQAIFWQLGKQTATALNDLGYYVNEAGLDSVVDLQAFTGSWRTHGSLRRAANKASRNGVVVHERELGEISIRDLQQVSDSWLAGRKNCTGNQRFLTRPLILYPEPDVRQFFAYQGGKLVGFRVFDPLYAGGKIVGYYADAIRISQNAPVGTIYQIMLETIKTFQAEGRQTLTLGYSPFTGMHFPGIFKSSLPTHWLCSFTYHNLEAIYGQKGLANHKRRFHGVEHNVYLASKNAFPLKDIINTCALTGINLPQQLLKAIGANFGNTGLAREFSPNPRWLPLVQKNGNQSRAQSG